MKLFYSKAPFNFLGISNQNFDNAKVVILPIPYDATTSYKSGTRDGPKAIIDASRHLEHYDIETKKVFSNIGFFTLDELECSVNSVQETLERIQNTIEGILAAKKFPVIIGGEHSITLGIVKAISKTYKNFSILQFDAHGDLRDEYEGSKFSHACVMRRCSEITNVTQVGIRSICQEEANFLENTNKVKTFFGNEFNVIEVINSLNENVYITIDIDSLDPSIMPSTGTPEPEGLSFKQILDLIKEVGKKKNIIGIDLVELAPIPGNVAPDFLAAKLLYKTIGYSVKT